MILKRFFDPKLAQASYILGCPTTRQALVVDPNRRVDQYLQAAADEGLRITHITETHIHADFVSGARELAARTGGRLYLSAAGGSEWQYHYAREAMAAPVSDGDRFMVGRIQLQALHLPGHTPEHLSFVVTDTGSANEPIGAFTGDFLFVGDVGRPDLLERAVGSTGTMEASARQLFRSLQRFRGLSDYLQIWPAHGAGSACGKSLSAMPQSTLGYEKRFNWAFGVSDEDEFVRAALAGQPEPPRYFAEMKRINQHGPRHLGTISLPAPLPAATLVSLLATGAIVVDTRESGEYGRGAVPGTINIPNTRAFTTWAGSLLPYNQEFYLISGNPGESAIRELIQDLAGIGLDRVGGYFGPEVITDWRDTHGPLQTIPVVNLEDLALGDGELVLDVRGEAEWKAGHVPDSVNVPLADLGARVERIPRAQTLVVHCQSGARAAIAASMLRAQGFTDVRLFPGGFAEWRSAGQPVAT
jgi:hydroxyacylglutathione hydrolase